MLEILLTLVPTFGIMLIGAMAERKCVLPSSTAQCLNRFVYYFSLPLLIFHSTAQLDLEAISGFVAIAFLLTLATVQAIGHIVFKILGDDHKNACMGSLVGAFPNLAYMGLPIILTLFPNSSVAFMNTTLAMVLATAIIIYTDVFISIAKNPRLGILNVLSTASKLLYHNPLLFCFVIGIIINISGITMPQSLMSITKMLGSTAAPCALFCMGMSLVIQLSQRVAYIGENTSKSSNTWHLNKQICFIMLKLILMPVVMFIYCYAFGERGISLASLTVLGAMPCAVTVTVVAERHNVMLEDSTLGVVFCTLFSVFTIFLTIYTLHFFKVY